MVSLKQQIKQLPLNWFGRLLYAFFPYRIRVIRANIAQVFGNQLTTSEKNHLIKAFYSHIATSLKEMIHLRFMTEQQLKNRVEVRGHAHVLSVAAQNQGVLILAAHVGNWEFAPIGGMLNFKQFKGHLYFIRRTLGNKMIEKILFRRYYQAGLNVIPKKNSLAQVCEVLAQNHGVVFVLDQHASIVNRDGIAAEFFGKKAGTYRSLAMIARYTGIPVIPVASFRTANNRHVLEFHEPLIWQDAADTKQAIYLNTCAYNHAIEQIILAHPEQWMWLHKRWKLKV